MGMFDYVVCKMPLPDPAAPDGTEFQTKDTDAQYMETYRIEADGHLVHEARDYEWDPERNDDGSVRTIAGALKIVNKRDEAVAYHGDIYFYGSDHMTGERWEYTARFTEGVCVRIMLDEHVPAQTEVIRYRSPPYLEGETDYAQWRVGLIADLKNLCIPLADDDTRFDCQARHITNEDGSRTIIVRVADLAKSDT